VDEKTFTIWAANAFAAIRRADALSTAQVLSDAWLPGNLTPKVADLLFRFCQAQRVTAIKTGCDFVAAC
jgi:hypothetical protein